MKAVILAGGFGTRLSEETATKPKPMLEIGGRPILWHIMKIYAYYGINEFIICLGYKGYIIKEYFANYFLHMSDVTFDLKSNEMKIHRNLAEPWKVTLIDTGENTMTGGRLKRISHLLNGTFAMTYGDGVANINIKELIEYHKAKGKLATLTAVRPSGRFGALKLDGNTVTSFEEKPKGDGGWINGGFFVLEPDIFNYIDGDQSVWEKDPLEQLAADGQLGSFKLENFWQAMDTLRDKKQLEELWQSGNAPWKIW